LTAQDNGAISAPTKGWLDLQAAHECPLTLLLLTLA
jgi:hypothetical protein